MSEDNYYSWSFAKLRDEILSSTDSVNALAEAGLLNEDTIRHLNSFEKHHSHDPLDPESSYKVENTDYWDQVVRPEVSVNLRNAVKNGRLEEVAYSIGLDSGGSSGSGNIREYERFRRRIKPDPDLILYAGAMGDGKTADALRTYEFAREVYKTLGDDLAFVGNIKSAAEDAETGYYVYNVLGILDARIRHDGPIFLLIDEASSFLTGYGRDQKFAADFGRLVRRLRKLYIIGCFIGHRTEDVTPNIRDMPGLTWITKPDKTTAEIWLDDGPSDQESPDFTLDGLDDTYIDFDTDDYTIWQWEGLDLLNATVEQGIHLDDVDSVDELREILDVEDGVDEEQVEELVEDQIQSWLDDKIEEIYEDEQSERATAKRLNVTRHRVQSALGRTAD
jgi:hypothetical protein